MAVRPSVRPSVGRGPEHVESPLTRPVPTASSEFNSIQFNSYPAAGANGDLVLVSTLAATDEDEHAKLALSLLADRKET